MLRIRLYNGSCFKTNHIGSRSRIAHVQIYSYVGIVHFIPYDDMTMQRDICFEDRQIFHFVEVSIIQTYKSSCLIAFI